MWGAIIGAAAQLGSSLLPSLLNKGGSSSYFDPAAAIWSTQMQKDLFDYQFAKQLEAMNTAHQREVTDLRKAGLNPILSATGGSGLNSPTSSMPDISHVNSAITAARQNDNAVKQQLKMQGLLALGDLLTKIDTNKAALEQADASQKSAEAAKNTSLANLKNAENNSLETASKIENRLYQNKNLSASTKKLGEELNLVKSQQNLNSALATKSLTDSYVAKELLDSEKWRNYSSGTVAGTAAAAAKMAVDGLKDGMKKEQEKKNTSALGTFLKGLAK